MRKPYDVHLVAGEAGGSTSGVVVDRIDVKKR